MEIIHFFTLYKENIISTPQVKTNKKPKAEHMINEAITFPKIYVIDNDGNQVGFLSKREAVERAKSAGFDLVVISDNPQKPVAKILDYGKFKYERKKKRKEAKVNQVITENKEIRLTPMIGEHDLLVKSKKAREFILKGDRVKVSLKFRGREMARKELGYETLDRFFKSLEDVAKIDKEAALTGGRFLDLYLARDKSKSGTVVAKPADPVIKEAQDAKNEN